MCIYIYIYIYIIICLSLLSHGPRPKRNVAAFRPEIHSAQTPPRGIAVGVLRVPVLFLGEVSSSSFVYVFLSLVVFIVCFQVSSSSDLHLSAQGSPGSTSRLGQVQLIVVLLLLLVSRVYALRVTLLFILV